MSKQVPALLPPRRDRPEVLVLDGERAAARPAAPKSAALARLALQLTPDVLRLVERSVAARGQQPAAAPPPVATAVEERVYAQGVRFSEVEYDSRLPWARKVTVRSATAWTTSAPAQPAAVVADDARGWRLRRAGLLGIGGAAAVAALGLLVKGGLPSVGGPRRFPGGR